MNPPFEYGICQEDTLTDARALEIRDGDRILCITSAGDAPLNFMAMHRVDVTSVDLLESQNCLARLKLQALLGLEPAEAAGLIGFLDIRPEERQRLYDHISAGLPEADRTFWETNRWAVGQGPVHTARFEQYMAKFSGIAASVLGRRKLYRLMEMDGVTDQEAFFDRHLSTPFLRALFRIAFHPKVYRKRGISEQGLTHSGERNTAEFFYGKFRDFCTATPARQNYYLQFSFFNRVLHAEALPAYLTETGISRIRAELPHLTVKRASLADELDGAENGRFNRFHLSNAGDWMSRPDFAALLGKVSGKATAGSTLLFRYIHLNHPIPEELAGRLIPDYARGEILMKHDRYPFYGLVPVTVGNI